MFRGLSAWRGLPAWCGASHAKSRMPGAAEGLAPRDGASQPSDGAPCSMVPQPPHLGSLILRRPLIGNAERLPGPEPRDTQAGSGAGSHVGGQDVIRMAVEVLAGPVITHRGAWIGVAGGDLDVPQVHSSTEHGRDKGMPEHVRVRAGNPYSCGLGEASQPPGGSVPIHPGTAAVEQDRALRTGADRPVHAPDDGWWQRAQDDLLAFFAYAQHPVAVLFAKVGD